jgi:Bacteriophage holin.
MATIMKRLKSPVVWAAVVAQVLTILLTLGAIETGTETLVNQIVAGMLQLLVIFGVLNNPTDQGGF